MQNEGFNDVQQGCPAREVVLSGPQCTKLVSRLCKFLVLFYRLKYICHQNTPKLYLLFLLWAFHPKTCITNTSKIGYVNFLDLVYIHTNWQHCVQL